MNIVSILEGNDPQLKEEYLVIGAHIEHFGQKSKEISFYSAKNSDTKSSKVLEIAKVYAQNDNKPKRSIIFVHFTNEDQGMIDSDFFVNHLSQLRCLF